MPDRRKWRGPAQGAEWAVMSSGVLSAGSGFGFLTLLQKPVESQSKDAGLKRCEAMAEGVIGYIDANEKEKAKLGPAMDANTLTESVLDHPVRSA